MIPALLFAAVFLFAYPFLLYPLLAAVLIRRYPPAAPAPVEELPRIAMVVCALNEQRVIRQKVENCLALDYPRDRLRLVFVSDGSTDATAAIVAEYADRGVELIERPQRRGKVANLNDVIASLSEEIVVLSDANVIYDRSALLSLLTPFVDPDVGGVSGRVILTNTTEEFRSSEEGYYSIEWKLQALASRIYSLAGADGAMYAFRRELFRPPPNDTIIEDFVVPIGIVRQGRRVLFQPAAVAWEDGPTSLPEEYRRKVRIAAGAAQALLRGNGWPIGAPARFWFVFASHKLLRWFSPAIGILAVALSAATPWHWLSRIVLAGAVALAAAAGLRAATGWKIPLLNAPFYFAFGQLAMLTGFMKGLRGRQSVLWAKAQR